jgi:hypothetical protein
LRIFMNKKEGLSFWRALLDITFLSFSLQVCCTAPQADRRV